MKIYVGCSLTHAPEEFKREVCGLKNKLSALPEVEVLEFLGLVAGTAHDVYVHDIIGCVGQCDMMVAICDFPSIGLGWEMATQVVRGKPLLAFAQEESKVTRFIFDPQVSGYSFHRYRTLSEVFDRVKSKLEREFATVVS